MTIIAAAAGIVVISIEYDSTGLAWAKLYDNHVLGWIIDEKTAGPVLYQPAAVPPWPLFYGTFPAAAPDTSPVVSPQWAILFTGPQVVVPRWPSLQVWRGQPAEFFSWLATNNGALRPLISQLEASTVSVGAFTAWARDNPDLVRTDEAPTGSGQ